MVLSEPSSYKRCNQFPRSPNSLSWRLEAKAAEDGDGSYLGCSLQSRRDTAVARRLPEGSLPWLSHYFLLISVTHPEGCWP